MNINGYTIERELGRGGMATVYLAIQVALERQVALKVMNPALAADEDFKNRFLLEGPIAAKLNDPQIVTIYDTGTDNEHYFLAMEYLPGGTLKHKIKQGLALERALAIAKMLGSALGYAHSRNVLHRDFKPHNVLFRDNGTPVLTDFGIAKAVGGNSQMTIPGASIGSPMYMSPEQAGGKDLDYRSDIYSLGVVFFEMLTGKPPYQSKDNFALALMHINEPIPQLPDELSDFQSVLDKLLAKAPDDRFKIAEQFVEALKQAEQRYYVNRKTTTNSKLTANSTPASPQPAPKPEKKSILAAAKSNQQKTQPKPLRSSNSKYIWWGGAAALVMIGFVFLFFMRGPDIDTLIAEAETLKQKGSLEESLNTVEEGLILNPDHPTLLELQEQVEQEQQHLVEAKRFLEEAIQLKQTEQLNDSLEALTAGLELAPENTDLRKDLLELQQEIETVLAQQEKELDIKNLLARAQQQFQEQRLLEPSGDNAFESFMQILELEEDNKTALDGLQQIASQYYIWAQDSQSTGPLSTTHSYVEKGLTVWPGHEGLLTLRKEVAQQTEKQEKGQAALVDARKTLQQNDFQGSLLIIRNGLLASPNHQELLDLEQEVIAKQAEAQRLAKADEILHKALALQQQQQFEEALTVIQSGLDYAPQHTGLIDLQQRITLSIEEHERLQQADALLVEARQWQQQEDLTSALKKIEQGLQLAPEHVDLLELQSELQAESDRLRGIAELLAQAQKQMKARQLTVPDGNNALETYQKILAIDSDHTEAQAGLDSIAAEYFRLADQNRAAGDSQKSLEFITKGLAVRPENSELIALQEAIKDQNQAKQYLAQAQQLKDQGEFKQSLEEVEKGLELAPLHADLLAFQVNLQADLYFIEAQRLLQQERAFTQSLDQVGKGLQLIPDHRQLLELQGAIQNLMQAEQHLAEARLLQEQGDLKLSLNEVNQGLKLVSRHAELVALKNALEQQIDVVERTQKADQYLVQAKSFVEKNNLNQALQEINKGLALIDEHSGLLVLQNHLLATQLRYEQVEQLLQQAQQLREEGRLDDAMQLTKQGLELVPEYEALFALQQKLTDELAQQMDLNERQQRAAQFFVQAQEQQNAGDLGMGLIKVQQGLKFLPEHAELQMLSVELQEQLMVLTQPELELAKNDAQGQATQEIIELLTLAKEQVKRQRLTRPSGNNAFENYQRILELDPRNDEAKSGLQAIAKRYLQWAQSHKRKGNLNKSLRNIDKGLSVFPKQKDLQALRREVVALLNKPVTRTPTRTSVQPPRILVDPCSIDKGSKACWCKTVGMFCK